VSARRAGDLARRDADARPGELRGGLLERLLEREAEHLARDVADRQRGHELARPERAQAALLHQEEHVLDERGRVGLLSEPVSSPAQVTENLGTPTEAGTGTQHCGATCHADQGQH
jgi:hypothetical protein